MHLGVFLVELVLLEILYDFCTWMYLNFLNFRKMSDLMFSNMTFVPFCLYSPSGIPIMQMLVHLMLSQRSLKLSSFLFIPFFLSCSTSVMSTFTSSLLGYSFSVTSSTVDSFKCVLNGEGNGNPLQYSCLENPTDRGAWWAAVHGVAKSRTLLEWLSMHACIGEGNGNPPQYSCLENPRDRGAWWTAIIWGPSESDMTEAT